MKNKFFLTFLFVCTLAQAQLSPEQKEQTLQDIFHILEERYVHPEVVVQIKEQLAGFYERGRYDSLYSGENFAFKVTNDLKEISNDLHLGLDYVPLKVSEEEAAIADVDDHTEWLNTVLTAANYGVSKKEILTGNIGYLNLPLFGPLDKVADTLIAAMAFVADTDALILDVRECRGSMDAYTIPFLSGYFFEEPVHLINYYTRYEDNTQQLWSAAWVPGKKYYDKPIYVLTSGRTFSGGEAFAFQLQKQKRATLVGNRTRGGGNPTVWLRINEQFAVSVPFATSTDPVDNSSWEGSGVIPDVAAGTPLALYEAHLLALRKLQKKAEDGEKEKFRGFIAEVEKNKPQFVTLSFRLPGYETANRVALTGSFNSWERESLLMERRGNEWVIEAEVQPGKHTYMFIVDGKWILDPANPQTEKRGEYVNSVLWAKEK